MLPSPSRDVYDGIILGAGHNGLVLQAYLARCGLKTLSIDRAPAPGGGLATIENPRLPGFFHHPHSFFHRGASAMPWYRDLDLERRGVRYIEPELNVAMVLADGRVLEWWTDLDRTIESFRQFSARDAAALRRWVEEFRPIVEEIIIPESQSPPLEPALRERVLGSTPNGRRLLEVSRLSPLEFVLAEFDDDAVRAGLLFFNGLREVDLRLSGFGHAIPALLASPRKAQMAIGGSASLARGLVDAVREHGGEILAGAVPRRLIVEGGRVAGVAIEGGERIRARGFVASALNPQQTFLELLPGDALPESCRRGAAGFRYNLLAPLFALDLALAEPPRYRAALEHPEIERAFMVIVGLESVAQFHDIVRAHEAGEIPACRVAWGACPTLFDPSQAPPGKHSAFLWEKLPYALGGDPRRWDEEGPRHARRLLEHWRRFAPNLDGGAVLDQIERTPLDTVRSLPNMAAGDLLVGSFAGGQVGGHRPFPEAGRYRTPLPGLYLCGGSTHPGGNITGLCGYNAAAVIAGDLGIRPWWPRRPFPPAGSEPAVDPCEAR
jgi:phytoene dehydrogenase-like protein